MDDFEAKSRAQLVQEVSQLREALRRSEHRYYLLMSRYTRAHPSAEGIDQDIDTFVEAEQELRESEARYRTLVEAMGDDAILIVDMEGRVEYGNAAAARQFGQPEQQLAEIGLEDLFSPDVVVDVRKRLALVLETGLTHRFELRLRMADRDTWMYVSLAPLKDKTGSISSFLAVGRDVTELVGMREELRALSLVDDLTGLHNRRGFVLLAGQQLKLAERTGKTVSLLMGDLDGLKAINDAFGHREGDAALIATARILKESCRDTDVVGRLGGDEFAVLAEGVSPPGTTSLANRLQQGISEWNALGGHPYQLSVSTGVATFKPGRSESLDSLLARADELMYEQKRRKRTQSRFFP